MMNRKRCVLALGILALHGCGAPPRTPEELDRGAVEGEITELSEAFWDAWRDGNAGLDRALAFFEDHPDFAYAAQGMVWRELSDVTEVFRSAFQVVQSQTIEIQETGITVGGEDIAYLMQSGDYSVTGTDGASSEMRPFAFSGLLVRTASGWRIRSAHFSEPCSN